jgi:hypothetical protein
MGGAVVMIGVVVVVVMTAEEEEDDDDVATAAGGCFTLINVSCLQMTDQTNDESSPCMCVQYSVLSRKRASDLHSSAKIPF